MAKSKRSKHSKSNRKRAVVEFAVAKIGFIGAGKIVEAIITGLVKYAKVDTSRIICAAPTTNNSDRLKNTFTGMKTSKRNIDVFDKFDSDIVFIAVNGNVIRNLYKLGGSRPAPITTNYIAITKHPVYICSLVPAYSLNTIREILLNPDNPEKYLVEMHRIALNCAVAQGLGICGVDVEPDSKKLSEPLRMLLTSITKHLEYIPEIQMDSAQALIGPSLAFCYSFINDVSLGGVKIGLNRPLSIKLSARAIACASATLLETGKHPNDLRDEVCAPSGGGIYATTVLDKCDVYSAISGAVEAAFKRAESLAKEDNPDSSQVETKKKGN